MVKNKMIQKNKIILDLCGGTGAWSQPYAEAGYDVWIIDPDYNGDNYISYPVQLFQKPKQEIYGILAAPPCTDFSVSGAQYWEKKGVTALMSSLTIVDACLRLVVVCKPKFWALENPVGRLVHYLGKPKIYFNPCDYGDPYTKKTCLWGNFNKPNKTTVEPIRSCSQGSWVQMHGGKSKKTKMLRSITPPGFAKAFFEANP